jgi:clan AA aspartic protease
MGHVYAEIELRNAIRSDLEPVTVRALADTGTLMLCIPEHLAVQLSLQRQRRVDVMLADGRWADEIDYVGPILVRFRDRTCFVGAYVMGNEVLLGAVPMEDMDLVIDPGLGQVKGRYPEGPRHRV